MTIPRSVGDWLGNRYEIVDVISGGMGVVYAAVDRLEGGPVGLKTLRPEYLADRERQGRFLTEARLWVGLDPHPNVVLADAIETFDGLPHIRLEWITGGHLGRWIATPRLDFPRALRFTVQFCLGMEHAQRGGVRCHRDVKPANLLVTEDGTLKITDFGLARLRDGVNPEDLAHRDEPIELDEPTQAQPIVWTDFPEREAERAGGAVPGDRAPKRGPAAAPEKCRATIEPAAPVPDPVSSSSDSSDPDATVAWTPGARRDDANYRTRANAMVGTVLYMAPEQFHDATAVDVRTDLYAFGIVLYEMLAGERPFKGYSAARLRHAHIHAKPRPVGGLLPRRWRRFADPIDAVVLRCLQKDPDRRYPSAAALRKDVQSILRQVDPTWKP